MGWFGVILGLLTALSTFAGTASTLIGLLIALIGGSFLSWYRDELLDDAKIGKIVLHTKKLAIGLLIGLVVGFACRFIDQAAIGPWLSKEQPVISESKRDQVAADLAMLQSQVLRTELNRLKKLNAVTDADLDRVMRVSKLVTETDFSKLAVSPKLGKSSNDRGGFGDPVFRLQSVTTNEMVEFERALQSGEGSVEDLRLFVSSWAQLRENSDEWLPEMEASLAPDGIESSVFERIKPLLDKNAEYEIRISSVDAEGLESGN